MGVDLTTYLMYGVKLQYPEEFDWENFEDEVSGTPGRNFDIVVDFMLGDYIVVGKIIKSIDNHDDTKFAEISLNDVDKEKLVFNIQNKLWFLNFKQEDLKLLMFNHYS